LLLEDADGDTKVQVEESSDEDKIRFDTGGTERMIIDSTGIDVTGTATATNMQVSNGGKYIFGGENTRITGETDGNGKIRLFTGGTEKVIIDGSNVGIGTSSPSDKLEIGTTTTGGNLRLVSSSYAGNGLARFYGTDGNEKLQIGSLSATSAYIYTPASTDLVTYTGGSERMRIDSSGNVGLYDGQYINWRLAPNSTYRGGIRCDSSANMSFETGSGGSERMRIDSSGNVGIGETSPDRKLHVNSGNTNECALFESTDTEVTIELKDTTGTAAIKSRNDFRFTAGGSERMRMDTSGRLLIGHQTAKGYALDVDKANIGVASFNRTGTDGEVVSIRKDGTPVGSIGNYSSEALSIISGDTGLAFAPDIDAIFPIGSITGARDNAIDLGRTNVRFDDIYATNGTIQTSDRNEKQDIEALTDAETRVAVAAKGLLRKFRWQSAVASKGDDARIHFGIIAQDLQDAFTAEGLDAGDYAMFISSTWTDDDGVEQTRLGVRYSELLAFIIAAI
jgi:hypothetical protein